MRIFYIVHTGYNKYKYAYNVK